MPPLRILPRVVAAASCTVIGAVAGLLGIGGSKLRLPVLVSFLALSIKVAITVNMAISLAVLVTSLIRRWESGAVDDASGWGALLVAILAGNMVGAWLGVRSAHRAREPKLARAMRLYLLAIGLLFFYEAFFHFPHLHLDRDVPAALVVDVLGGVAVGWVASVFGVAGGELRTPLPTVSDTVLRLLLGTVLVISAIRFDARPLDAQTPHCCFEARAILVADRP